MCEYTPLACAWNACLLHVCHIHILLLFCVCVVCVCCVCMCVCVCAADGLKWLSDVFHLCHAMDSGSKVQALKDWLSGTWFNLAMGKWVGGHTKTSH